MDPVLRDQERLGPEGVPSERQLRPPVDEVEEDRLLEPRVPVECEHEAEEVGEGSDTPPLSQSPSLSHPSRVTPTSVYHSGYLRARPPRHLTSPTLRTRTFVLCPVATLRHFGTSSKTFS